jgi:release factor glutamine methyltransferase
MTDEELLRRDKYNNEVGEAVDAGIEVDLKRLASGEPQAYVIGWIPFLGLKIYLDQENFSDDPMSSFRPLIPRPETEWWTEKLIAHLQYKYANDASFTLLDLCAGSGAIGLSILAAFPNAHVAFADIEPGTELIIQRNIAENNLDASRAEIFTGDLFIPLSENCFDVIATNPPYIPDSSKESLSKSVTEHEPHSALFAGETGLIIIEKILSESPSHLNSSGELWMECDINNIGTAEQIASASGFSEVTIHNDLYGRPRLLTATYET